MPLAADQTGFASQITLLLPLILIAGMLFLMFRSRKKQMAQQAAMITSLTPGTRVLLGNGFYGVLRSIEEGRAEVEIAPGVVTTVVTNAILRAETEAERTGTQEPGDDIIGRDRRDDPPASPIEER